MKHIDYISGQSLNIGLNWTDLSSTAVDVSGAEEIKLQIVRMPFMEPVLSFSKSAGTLVVSEDKCLVTLTDEQTEDLWGPYLVEIELTQDSYTRKAISDYILRFKKLKS